MFLLGILVASINRSRILLLLLLFFSMLNNGDEMSDVGSEERARLEREQQRLERQARLAELNIEYRRTDASIRVTRTCRGYWC